MARGWQSWSSNFLYPQISCAPEGGPECVGDPDEELKDQGRIYEVGERVSNHLHVSYRWENTTGLNVLQVAGPRILRNKMQALSILLPTFSAFFSTHSFAPVTCDLGGCQSHTPLVASRSDY